MVSYHTPQERKQTKKATSLRGQNSHLLKRHVVASDWNYPLSRMTAIMILWQSKATVYQESNNRERERGRRISQNILRISFTGLEREREIVLPHLPFRSLDLLICFPYSSFRHGEPYFFFLLTSLLLLISISFVSSFSQFYSLFLFFLLEVDLWCLWTWF